MRGQPLPAEAKLQIAMLVALQGVSFVASWLLWKHGARILPVIPIMITTALITIWSTRKRMSQ